MKYKARYYKYRKLIEILKRFKRNCKHFSKSLLKWSKNEVPPTSYCVIPEKRIAYLVIPKNACSSIKKALVGLEKDTVYYDIHKIPQVVHSHRHRLNKEEEKYFKFTFVRNPYQRIVSFWINKFYRRVKINKLPFRFKNYLGGNILTENMTFEEMIKVIYGIPPYLANAHFRSQSYIIDSQSVVNGGGGFYR